MTLISSARVYAGRVVNLDLDTVRFPDDSTGQLEMLRHPGAAAVVPFLDPPRGRRLHLGGARRQARQG
jgi:ADP-ribose pyrophosphatase